MTPEVEIPSPVTKRVSIVIVSCNRATQLRKSLETLGDQHQIVVVDNGSGDGAADLQDLFPAVRFIRLPRNFGLTKALNIGVRSAEADLILLLHDDVLVAPDAVAMLAEVMETRPDVGAACPLLTTAAGEPAPQTRALPSQGAPDPSLVRAAGETAECVSLAALMLRASFLRAMRYFDESYGTYGSDLDLCWQLRHAQKKILIVREARAVHDKLASPVRANALEGDRVNGTATFLGKRHGILAGILYRLKKGLGGLFTFRFGVVGGAWGGTKIDGTR